MAKNVVQPEAADSTRMRVACWISRATRAQTHSRDIAPARTHARTYTNALTYARACPHTCTHTEIRNIYYFSITTVVS